MTITGIACLPTHAHGVKSYFVKHNKKQRKTRHKYAI